ncbi:MAG TPA: carboxypeptidase-like regulatory domain-containing protein, partial [Rariglobus sp.]
WVSFCKAPVHSLPWLLGSVLLAAMMPRMRRVNRCVVLVACACLWGGMNVAFAEQGAPAMATERRIDAVKALRPENEEKLDARELLASLGRYEFGLVSTEQEAGRIEVSFTDEQGGALPLNGWLSYEVDDGKNYGCMQMIMTSGIAPVSEGRASVVLRGKERRVILYADGLPGYAFAKKDRFGRKDTKAVISLPEGTTRVQELLSLEAAGAIRWRVVDEHGKPETEKVKFWLYTPPYSTGGGSVDPPYGRFFIRSAQLNESYRLVLQKGARFADSSPPPLTLAEPVADLVIAFKPGKKVAGRLVDSEGRPLAGMRVRLGYQMLEPQPQSMEDAAVAVTGSDGRFAFDSINLDMPNRYWAVFVPPEETGGRSPLPMHRIAINAKTEFPVEMKLPVVHAARGRLLDAATGRPVVGVRVWALMHEQFSKTGRPNWLPVFQVPAVGPSDESGAFQFTNLPSGVYDFRLSEGRLALNRSEVSAEGGARIAGETDIDLLRVPQTAQGEPAIFWVRP